LKVKVLFLTITLALSFIIVPTSMMQKLDNFKVYGQALREAPDFVLYDMEGKSFKLSQLKGKVVLLDFWATWCPFCRKSIPILISLYNEYKDKGLEIVGVALEYDGGKVLKIFAEKEKINYTVLIGNEKVAREYSAYGVPTRFLINREGQIVERFVGFQNREVLESAIKELL
jgi:cytochrome c biogenesis protein CcmG/thiol:disulfide interchange protein DsbE